MPGKELAQSISEMSEIGEQKRQNKLYRVESQEFASVRIADLVRASMSDLAALADGKQKISLPDTKALQTQTIIYLRSCEENGILPSMSGLARALGHSRNSLYNLMHRQPNSPSAEWLTVFQDLCSDLLAVSALRGDVQPVVSIFLEKAAYGMKENNEIIIQNGQAQTLTDEDRQEMAAQLMSRYGDIPDD